MILSLLDPLQAAVEYGATTSMAAELTHSLAAVRNSARDAFEAVSSNPMLLGGVLFVAVLLFLLLRNPAR
jgi:hypothetical protein